MAFHVFVEGATDRSPGGLERLAEAMSSKYKLPAAELVTRLGKGRFRVKGNVERAVAEQYKVDLEALGARCVIEEANAANSRPTPLPFAAPPPPQDFNLPTNPPATRAAAPTPARPAAAPPLARPAAGAPVVASPAAPLPRPSTPPPVAGYQSGLSAAFSDAQPAASLGALERADATFSLSSVDGAEGSDSPAAAPEAAFAPPASVGSIGPAVERPAVKKKDARPKDEPLDLFVPPDAESDSFKVELAADEVEISARKRASTPPMSVPITDVAAEPAERRSRPSLQAPNVPAVAPAAPRAHPLANVHLRFIAGVVIAIAVGALPAMVVASMREKSAFEAIDNKVKAAQDAADTPDAYAALDRLRDEQLARKKSERQTIAIMALAIWGIVGGAVGYGWFRRIPWARFDA